MLLAVLTPLALWLRNSSLVGVQDVSVAGIDGTQAAQIKGALEAAGRDMTTLHVRENALLSAVAAYPVVRSLRTETDFPHGLRITINAYEPVAAVRAGAGLAADRRRRHAAARKRHPRPAGHRDPGAARRRALAAATR